MVWFVLVIPFQFIEWHEKCNFLNFNHDSLENRMAAAFVTDYGCVSLLWTRRTKQTTRTRRTKNAFLNAEIPTNEKNETNEVKPSFLSFLSFLQPRTCRRCATYVNQFLFSPALVGLFWIWKRRLKEDIGIYKHVKFDDDIFNINGAIYWEKL